MLKVITATSWKMTHTLKQRRMIRTWRGWKPRGCNKWSAPSGRSWPAVEINRHFLTLQRTKTGEIWRSTPSEQLEQHFNVFFFFHVKPRPNDRRHEMSRETRHLELNELNAKTGLPRDRWGYWPLYYRGLLIKLLKHTSSAGRHRETHSKTNRPFESAINLNEIKFSTKLMNESAPRRGYWLLYYRGLLMKLLK